MVPEAGLEPARRSIWFWVRQVYQFHHSGIESVGQRVPLRILYGVTSFESGKDYLLVSYHLVPTLAMRGIYYSLCLQPLRRTPLWLFGMDVIADASGGPGWTWTNNRIKHLIYSQGWYQLHCTDPNKKYLFILIYFIFTWISLEGHPGLKPGRLQDGGFTEIFLKIQQLKSLSSLEKKSGCPVRCVYQFHQWPIFKYLNNTRTFALRP